MSPKKEPKQTKEKEPSRIYMSTNHLKEGTYELHLLSNTEVIKIIPFKK